MSYYLFLTYFLNGKMLLFSVNIKVKVSKFLCRYKSLNDYIALYVLK